MVGINYTVKFNPDGFVHIFKTLVVKGFSHLYAVDYFEIFSLITRFNSIHILLSLVNLE